MQRETPLISVVIPAYNHEAYIEESIRSVLSQDYPRIELVIVDDCSRDMTWSVIGTVAEECRKKLERVVVDRNETNLGACETYNKAWSLMTGAFFIPLASDDRLSPGALSALLKPMLENENVGVVVGQNQIMDGDGRICFWDKDRNNVYSEEAAKWRSFNEYLHEVTGIDQFGSEFGTYASFSRANHVANGYLIRKSVLDKVLPFTKDAPLEDYWLHLQLSKLTLYNSIDTSTFVYRWHASNTIKQQERIHQFWYDTLLWEVRNNERRGGKWKRLYRDIEVDRKCQWSLIGVRCERVRGLFYKWRELYICGLHFVLMKRMINKRRNPR